MEAVSRDYLGESRAQAARSAAWLRRCNGALLWVILVVIGSSVLLVVAATVVNITGGGRHDLAIERAPLIVLSFSLTYTFAKIGFSSYRRGIDDLAERERQLREIETLQMVAQIASDKGGRDLLEKTLLQAITENVDPQFAGAASPTVVSIEDLASASRAPGPLHKSLSLWKARVLRANQKLDASLSEHRSR